VDGGAEPDLGADEATFDRYNWGWLGRDIETLGNAGLQIGPPSTARADAALVFDHASAWA
jgi:hypothetical protein